MAIIASILMALHENAAIALPVYYGGTHRVLITQVKIDSDRTKGSGLISVVQTQDSELRVICDPN